MSAEIEAETVPLLILHPSWCRSARPLDEDDYRVGPGRHDFLAPAEADAMHRGRILHVDTKSSAYTACVMQPFEVASGALVSVSTPTVEFTAVATETLESFGAWMSVSEIPQVTHMLEAALSAFLQDSGKHLPVEDFPWPDDEATD